MKDEQIRDVELGEEARNFLDSHLGKEVLARANERYEANLLALAKVDPHDPKSIQRLQNQVQLFETFDEWLREIVDTGNAALEAFRQDQQKT